MTRDELMIEVDKQFGRCKRTLMKKNEAYAGQDNVFFNFEQAASLQLEGVQDAIMGMMVKHEVQLHKMVNGIEEVTTKQLNETIGDILNYLFLLRAYYSTLEL